MGGLFRPLNADEIECRIGTIKEPDDKSRGGVTLLLYKDARCDMNILDEAFGPFGWQRHHSRDNRNCIVSIFDEQKNEWIEKEDTGTESNMEAEKGLASDSFKRACTCWGIGRELYTAPKFIWVPGDKCELRQNGKGKWFCNDKFRVVEIGYYDKGEINRLIIANDSKGIDVYFFPRNAQKGQKNASIEEPKKDPPANQKAEPGGGKTPQQAPDGRYYCEECNSVITPLLQNGTRKTDREVAQRGIDKHGKQLCWHCQKDHASQAS